MAVHICSRLMVQKAIAQRCPDSKPLAWSVNIEPRGRPPDYEPLGRSPDYELLGQSPAGRAGTTPVALDCASVVQILAQSQAVGGGTHKAGPTPATL